VLAVLGGFMLYALFTRAREAFGVGSLRCGCEPECWCKRPSLTVFRWVTPRRTHHLVSPADKEQAEAGLSD
jgi:hypothetical protein